MIAAEHGLNLAVLVVVAATFLVWSLIVARVERWNLTAPMFFVIVGFSLMHWPFHVEALHLGSTAIREVAEITLAVVLFGDAARVSVNELRHDAAVPTRLLTIGLPLSMVLGTVLAHLLLPGVGWWVCAVVGAAVAPTDAALGAAIVDDERVPERIRRILNVESGLNDGIATPFVKFFLVAAVVGTSLETSSSGRAVVELVVGAVGGVLIGAAGGWLLVRARAAGWTTASTTALGVTALALVAYAACIEAGGNGFVAAFVAGLAYGTVTRHADEAALEFTHESGQLLSMVVWFLFGAVMLPALAEATWHDIAFALAALTVARMVPVALALLGTGFDRATIVVLGWFGPRGLASVVFALLAYESLAPGDGLRVVTVITATVLFSVVLHGVSAAPVGKRYGATHADVADAAALRSAN
jgi:NhaP-type Na+/H+ or K+/H+ antiporter